MLNFDNGSVAEIGGHDVALVFAYDKRIGWLGGWVGECEWLSGGWMIGWLN